MILRAELTLKCSALLFESSFLHTGKPAPIGIGRADANLYVRNHPVRFIFLFVSIFFVDFRKETGVLFLQWVKLALRKEKMLSTRKVSDFPGKRRRRERI